MSKVKLQSSVIGAFGEHLVLSELLKRGYVAGLDGDGDEEPCESLPGGP